MCCFGREKCWMPLKVVALDANMNLDTRLEA